MESITTGNLHDTLKSIPSDLLVVYYYDCKKKFFDEVDEIIRDIIAWELDYRAESISIKDTQLRKWRKDLEYSLFSEIAIRYGALKTNKDHSQLVGFTKMEGYVVDEEKMQELIEDAGRLLV